MTLTAHQIEEQIRRARFELAEIDSLHVWEENPRDNDIAAESLEQAIREVGYGQPMVAQLSSRMIIAGHTRFKASKRIGLQIVPVFFVDVDDETARDMAIADNRQSEIAKWRFRALFDLLSVHSTDKIEKLGWKAPDLAELRRSMAIEVRSHTRAVRRGQAKADDEAPAPPLDPVSRLGDLWTLGEHRLFVGSCADLPRVLPEFVGKAALLATDPPYGVAYDEKQDRMVARGVQTATRQAIAGDASGFDAIALWRETFPHLRELLGDGAAFYVFGPTGELVIDLGQALRDLVGKPRHLIPWVKNHMTLSRGRDYHGRYEPFWYGWTDGRHFPVADRAQDDVWEYDRPARSTIHPHQKPVELVARQIRNSCAVSDVVVDGFAGSGTTLVACEQETRICIAAEISPALCDAIVERWERMAGEKAERQPEALARALATRDNPEEPTRRPKRPPKPRSAD